MNMQYGIGILTKVIIMYWPAESTIVLTGK